MIIQGVPFYKNLDDTHCFQAVIKMILKYFLPKKDFNWSELEELTGKEKDMYTWSMRGWINLKKIGFEVLVKDTFDYQRFAKEGEDYLKQELGEDVAREQIMHSDIRKEMRDAEEYVKSIGHEKVLPNLEDIFSLIDKGFLVGCGVNANILDNSGGYDPHFILIFGYDENNVYIHDPGPPAHENWKLPLNLFLKAWEYPDTNSRNLEAYKYGIDMVKED